jgi:ABC-type multidrug transport system permease subunit
MQQIFAIMRKDLNLWVRRPAYLIASLIMAVLIVAVVGDTLSGARHIPFGIYDPGNIGDLNNKLGNSEKFALRQYSDPKLAESDLRSGKIIAFAKIDQDPLEDSVEIVTEGHNPFVDDQISMGLLRALTGTASNSSNKNVDSPLKTTSLSNIQYELRDYITPGLAAYLCYVLASMNLGFSWIYEWMEKTYRQIILAPHGLRSAIIAKTTTVTLQASSVLWIALLLTSPLAGFQLGNNPVGVVLFTLLSVFCFASIGLSFACWLRTIRVYTMTVSILGVALMFISGIIVPLEAMPVWEQAIARCLPLYYAADAFKGVILNTPAHYSEDILVLALWSFAGLVVSSLLLTKRQAAL